MMVGVPVLLIVCVSAFVPFVWVMGVVVCVCGWCCFQCWVAVVWASRRVPGVGVCVSWFVSGACARVVGVGVGVSWLVCVLWWFRILMCVLAFLFFLGFVFCLVNNGLPWVWCGCLLCVWCVRVLSCCVCAPAWWLVLLPGRGGWCALVGYWVVVLVCLVCARILCVCGLVLFFVCGVWVCLVCMVSVVVWVRGVLLLVVGCLCGLVMRLLGVV